MCEDKLSFFEIVSKIKASIGLYTILFLLSAGMSLLFLLSAGMSLGISDGNIILFFVWLFVFVLLSFRTASCFVNANVKPKK